MLNLVIQFYNICRIPDNSEYKNINMSFVKCIYYKKHSSELHVEKCYMNYNIISEILFYLKIYIFRCTLKGGFYYVKKIYLFQV